MQRQMRLFTCITASMFVLSMLPRPIEAKNNKFTNKNNRNKNMGNGNGNKNKWNWDEDSDSADGNDKWKWEEDLDSADGGATESACTECTDLRTPWMVAHDKYCHTWDETMYRCNQENNPWANYWSQMKFCQKTCFQRGFGYDGDNCCLSDEDAPDADEATQCRPCTNFETPWMAATGKTCDTWHLKHKCINDQTGWWQRERFCSKRCFEIGLGYEGDKCCPGGQGDDQDPEVDAAPSSPNAPEPSSKPTKTPSKVPSNSMTNKPSTRPSLRPSARPSARPSYYPTANPSSQPSTEPTSDPSSAPTANPSSAPSGEPSARPGARPSLRPSAHPFAQPSSAPTSSPSSNPTVYSSPAPSESLVETDSNSCVECSNEPTPYMIGVNKTCDDWGLTLQRCKIKTTFWINNQFCAKTCADADLGYAGLTNCCDDDDEITPDTSSSCVMCSNTPSTWMLANGHNCADWKGLKSKCGPNGQTQSFIDNKFCALSCFERYGISFIDDDGNEEVCC